LLVKRRALRTAIAFFPSPDCVTAISCIARRGNNRDSRCDVPARGKINLRHSAAHRVRFVIAIARERNARTAAAFTRETEKQRGEEQHDERLVVTSEAQAVFAVACAGGV
jgi:hypothetical protein